jgi:hypothetical protein
MKVSMAMSLAIALAFSAGCAHSGPSTESTPRVPEEPAWADEGEKVPERACTAETTVAAPADGRIATQGKLLTYPPDSSAAPTVTPTNGGLHVSANVPVKADAQYAGVVIDFPKCMDASAFAGVRFKIRGSYSGCSMEYGTKDVQHEDRNHGTAFATGRRGAYPPQTRFEKAQVTPVAQTVTIPFGETSMKGNPPLPLDKSKLTGVVWQFTVGMASNVEDGSKACLAELDIDDVVFYR